MCTANTLSLSTAFKILKVSFRNQFYNGNKPSVFSVNPAFCALGAFLHAWSQSLLFAPDGFVASALHSDQVHSVSVWTQLFLQFVEKISLSPLNCGSK